MDTSLPEKHRRLYGRHVGKPLRPRQKQLIADLLPRLTLDPDRIRADGAKALADIFGRTPRALALEIGFGGGEHLAAQARAYPAGDFIGCEHFVNGIASLLGHIAGPAAADPPVTAIANIRIYPDDARKLIDALPAQSLTAAFVLFPDPWPKKRHIERRFIQADTLSALARVLRPGGKLRMASDMPFLVEWMQATCLAHPDFTPAPGTHQGRHQPRPNPSDAPFTRYEQKAITAGREGVYLEFLREK